MLKCTIRTISSINILEW